MQFPTPRCFAAQIWHNLHSVEAKCLFPNGSLLAGGMRSHPVKATKPPINYLGSSWETAPATFLEVAAGFNRCAHSAGPVNIVVQGVLGFTEGRVRK